MSVTKTQPFDPAAYLHSHEAIAAYTAEALESEDPALIEDALGVVARANEMSEIARETDLSRDSL